MSTFHLRNRLSSSLVRIMAVLPALLAGAAHAVDSAAPAATTSATAAAAAAAAPGSNAGSIFTMLFGLVVVLALMAALAWLFKRSGLVKGVGSNAVAKIIGGVSVGTRERVMVIEVADQWIVVGVAPGRVNTLATLPRQEHAAATSSDATPAANFSSWLKQTIDKRNASS